tara:strand:+ start:1435 stop:1623 length:189 start_codon:yes stop_codon:yes gene_type:complete
MERIYKVKKALEFLAKVLVDSIVFIVDLMKWIFLVVLLVSWTFSAFVFISTMRFFEKKSNKF